MRLPIRKEQFCWKI